MGFTPVVDAAFGGASEVAMGAMAVVSLLKRGASGFERRWCTTLSKKGSVAVF